MLKLPRRYGAPPSYAMCFDPGTAMLGLALAGTAVQASNTAAAGKAEGRALQAAGRAEARAGIARQQGLEHQAAQLRQQAGQERATSQRSASEKRRQGRLLASRALAVAGASGAGAGDPTVEKIIGDIGAEGEFRALSEMFIGEERALGLETQADLREFEGRQERIAGQVARRAGDTAGGEAIRAGKKGAFGQVLSGVGKLGLARFG